MKRKKPTKPTPKKEGKEYRDEDEPQEQITVILEDGGIRAIYSTNPNAEVSVIDYDLDEHIGKVYDLVEETQDNGEGRKKLERQEEEAERTRTLIYA